MTRIARWEQALAAAVEAAAKTRFEWGVTDCATWAFDVRFALTGIDDAARWRGQYATEVGAARMLLSLGWASYEEGCRALLGAPLPSVLFAQRGDIVIGGDAGGVAVCIGAHAVGMQPAGLSALDLGACTFAWRV